MGSWLCQKGGGGGEGRIPETEPVPPPGMEWAMPNVAGVTFSRGKSLPQSSLWHLIICNKPTAVTASY